MIEIGSKNKILKTKVEGIIFIIFQYFHYWKVIIVYLWNIWLKVFSGFKKQLSILMSLLLDMINPTLHVNKYFKEQAENFMNNVFGTLTQPFI